MREDGARIPQLRTGGPFPYWHSGCRDLSISMKSSQPKGQHEPGEGRLVSIVFRHESEDEESCAISNLIEEDESDDKIRFGRKKTRDVANTNTSPARWTTTNLGIPPYYSKCLYCPLSEQNSYHESFLPEIGNPLPLLHFPIFFHCPRDDRFSDRLWLRFHKGLTH